MKKTKRSSNSNELAGEKLFRSSKFNRGSVNPLETMNGQSNIDGYDRSELNVEDQHATAKDQQGFIEDFDGDEDFYGDDEENQSGSSSYTGHQSKYLGQGDWADKQYGEHQFDHKGDVSYSNPDRQDVHGITPRRRVTER
jgi:hypothetical protein